MKVYLICDESGAKGYSDKKEQYLGETGVFAGFLVTEDKIDYVRDELKKIAEKYFNDEKYHLSSLSDDKKESLRNEIYDFFQKENLTCVYEAIHVEGFYEEHKRVDDIKKDAKKKRQSNIRFPNNPKLTSLHAELFQGLFLKSLAYCIDTFGNDYDLIILSDRVDKPILKRFKESAVEVTDFTPTEKMIKGYDIVKEEHVEWNMKISSEIPKSLGMEDFESAIYKIEIDEENSGLTLVSDILSNSINYIFKSREDNEIGKPLNDIEHPLINQFYGLMDANEQAWITDSLYMHPNEIKRIEENNA
jgi:hypothetical protein